MNAIVLVELAAVAAITAGVWAIYWPAALIVAGLLVLGGAQGIGRVSADEDGE